MRRTGQGVQWGGVQRRRLVDPVKVLGHVTDMITECRGGRGRWVGRAKVSEV